MLLAALGIALTLVQPSAARANLEGTSLLRQPTLSPLAEEGLYRLIHFRVTARVSPASNVAVVRYFWRGEYRWLPIVSRQYSPGGEPHNRVQGHSESRFMKILTRRGVDPDDVRYGISERQPCTLPGRSCATQLERRFQHLTMDHLYAYPWERGVSPEERALNTAIRTAANTAVKYFDAGIRPIFARDAASGLFRAPGIVSNNTLASSVSLPEYMTVAQGGARGTPLGVGCAATACGPQDTGGIDFSTLELRYVADTGSAGERGMQYALRAQPGASAPEPGVGLLASRQASDAFFVWLALPPRSFWVNLNPTEPNRIIDPQFGRSDAGRVLLESDLIMKKVVAPLVHPDTPTGAQWWKELDALYGNRGDAAACFSFRQWIVPAPAIVRSTARELYILDAPLEVKMESDYLGAGTVAGDCPADPPALNASKQELYRRLILPHVQNAVNTHPAFAPLRRVYLSLVAAEWFRLRSGQRRTALSPVANRGKIDSWVARPPWNPLEVFNRYVVSVRDGEFNVARPVQYGGVNYTRTYVYGGVDFSRTPMVNVTSAQFKARWPLVARQVKQSLRRRARDAQSGATWFGGSSARP